MKNLDMKVSITLQIIGWLSLFTAISLYTYLGYTTNHGGGAMTIVDLMVVQYFLYGGIIIIFIGMKISSKIKLKKNPRYSG